MKKLLLSVLSLGLCLAVSAQTTWYDAYEMGLGGKVLQTENPYHRADTSRYAFVGQERNLVLSSGGLTLHFKTNSKNIRLIPEYGYIYPGRTTNQLAVMGFDMYIRQGKGWLWAGAAVHRPGREDRPLNIVANMDGTEHECLIYLPMYCELRSLKMGLDDGSTMIPCEPDSKYRIVFHGSSFTMAVSASRSGMGYPQQFGRYTGMNVLGFGMSGNCKLQPAFAAALSDAQFDALVLDTFSNPSVEQIRERLFPFIETVQAAHPGVPLIFQRTIYRENRNFNKKLDAEEAERIQVADSLMAIACKRYKDVYYIHPNATTKDHQSSVDGTHPGDYGYYIWEKSIEKKVLRILRKYGIK
ncbi:MAG: SGNH/GDSL hydrolase family protein [Bacteroidales bacterium]|nr:SGNH/GDSL hydrolase family protein [Bacteroidales bacterium]